MGETQKALFDLLRVMGPLVFFLVVFLVLWKVMALKTALSAAIAFVIAIIDFFALTWLIRRMGGGQ